MDSGRWKAKAGNGRPKARVHRDNDSEDEDEGDRCSAVGDAALGGDKKSSSAPSVLCSQLSNGGKGGINANPAMARPPAVFPTLGGVVDVWTCGPSTACFVSVTEHYIFCGIFSVIFYVIFSIIILTILLCPTESRARLHCTVAHLSRAFLFTPSFIAIVFALQKVPPPPTKAT